MRLKAYLMKVGVIVLNPGDMLC